MLRTADCPVSIRHIVGVDRSSCSAATFTVSPALSRSSRRYLPSCLRGTVDPLLAMSGIDVTYPFR